MFCQKLFSPTIWFPLVPCSPHTHTQVSIYLAKLTGWIHAENSIHFKRLQWILKNQPIFCVAENPFALTHGKKIIVSYFGFVSSTSPFHPQCTHSTLQNTTRITKMLIFFSFVEKRLLAVMIVMDTYAFVSFSILRIIGRKSTNLQFCSLRDE